jgi:dTDP-4-amino-4,6-dideoxygalactose transaminase
MDRLMAISKETGVPILEDCSHAHGAQYGGRIVGSIGQVGVWSLQGSKPVSAGEGGILATNDSEIFERACLAGQVNRMGGLDLVTKTYAHLQPLGLGMKFRAHPLGIGIAAVQFKKLPALNQKRKEYVEAVEERIKTIPGLGVVKVYEKAERGGYYAFPIVYEPDHQNSPGTADIIEAIRQEGLAASFSPYQLLHRLPLFVNGFDLFTGNRGPLSGEYRGYKEGDFPNSEAAFSRLIFLPMLSDPVPDAVDRIAEKLERAMLKMGAH